jgi:multidrug efflux pump subunit AcrB
MRLSHFHTVNFVDFSGATFTIAPNSGALFARLEPFEARAKNSRKSVAALQLALRQKLSAIQDGLVLVITPSPVRGIGTAGGLPHDD